MKERAILFSGAMVRAILEGRKTQTRRVIKNTGLYAIEDHHGTITAKRERAALATQCRFGIPGDRLWVRETWQGPLIDEELDDEFRQSPDYFKKPAFCAYRATDKLDAINADGEALGWRPSIHMPRWACRILLEITSVRVERLKDIGHEDAMAEGMAWDDAVYDYSRLWDSLNGNGSWDANPWVWVIEFKRVMR